MDAEACDVWDVGHPPSVLADESIPNVIYVSRRRYDHDLASCLRTRAAVRRQLEIDVPRCKFSLNGKRYTDRTAPTVSLWLARYCNQAVLGLPVSLLSSVGLVAEPTDRCPLHVQVWEGEAASVLKRLRIILPRGRQRELNVHVDVQRLSEWVTVRFDFEHESKSEIHLE